MIRTHKISGMTCEDCTQIVHDSLAGVAGVKKVNVDLAQEQARVEMDRDIPPEVLQAALTDTLYRISEAVPDQKREHDDIVAKEARKKNKALVANYITAVGRRDYEKLLRYLHSDFKFDGGMKINSAKAYIEMLKEHAAAHDVAVLKTEIKAIFIDENEACVIYDQVTNKPVEPLSFVEWVKLREDKILSTRIKFDRYGMRQLIQALRKEKDARSEEKNGLY